MSSALALLVMVATGTTGAAPAAASAPRPADPTVPLAENFSAFEVTAAVVAAASGVFLLGSGHLLFDAPPPRLGAGNLESRISRGLSREGGGRFLWRMPDALGIVLPALPLVYYGVDSWGLLMHGQPLFARADGNPHHRLISYVEAVGFTYLLTGVVKYSVGRARPYTEAANDHPELRRRRSEDNLSFFSGHSSTSFAVGAFLAEDLSRAAARHGLGGTPAARLLLGTVLPYGLGYGLPALVALSRVVDQQHWPSDVALGAVAGVLIARLTYARHFQADGRPRRRRVLPGQLAPVALGSPGGGFGLLYGAAF